MNSWYFFESFTPSHLPFKLIVPVREDSNPFSSIWSCKPFKLYSQTELLASCPMDHPWSMVQPWFRSVKGVTPLASLTRQLWFWFPALYSGLHISCPTYRFIFNSRTGQLLPPKLTQAQTGCPLHLLWSQHQAWPLLNWYARLESSERGLGCQCLGWIAPLFSWQLFHPFGWRRCSFWVKNHAGPLCFHQRQV